MGDEITVMVIEIDSMGRVNLSRRALSGDGAAPPRGDGRGLAPSGPAGSRRAAVTAVLGGRGSALATAVVDGRGSPPVAAGLTGLDPAARPPPGLRLRRPSPRRDRG